MTQAICAFTVLCVVSLRAEHDPRRTLVVGSCTSRLAYDAVKIYFESEKHSGGGTIESFSLRRKDNVGLIVFEEAEGNNVRCICLQNKRVSVHQVSVE